MNYNSEKKSMDLNATTEFRDHNIIIYIMKHSFSVC